MFRKLIYLFLALALFALVWAAGHDILNGEPDVWMEWLIVFAGGALAMRLALKKFRVLRRAG